MRSDKPTMMGRGQSGKKPLPDVSLLLQQAIAHHDAGRHSEAAAVSREILAVQPGNAIALDLTGVDLYLRGELNLATTTLKRAIRNNDTIPDIHNHLGLALEAQGKLDAAVDALNKSITLKPDYAEAHINLGNVLNKLDRPMEAIACYQKAIAINPRDALGYFNLGVVLERRGRLEEAIGSYRGTLELDSDNTEALFNLGSCLQKLAHKEQLEQAIKCFSRILALKPDHFKAQLNLGAAQFSLHRLEDALASFRKAVDLDPDDAMGHYDLGSALLQLRRLEDARKCFERSIAINPDYVGGHNNLGMTLNLMGEWDEARFHYFESLRIEPDNVETNANLGSLYREQGEFEAAISHLNQAIKMQPDRAEAHWNLSLPLLATGNLAQGWEEYEWRWQGNERWIPTAPKNRNFPQPWWDGADPKDKTLLVWGEQGVGDEIAFANVLPDIIAAAKHCVVECEPRLVSLFERSFPSAEVVARSVSPDPRTLEADIELQIPIGSLPRWFRPNIESFPHHRGYLIPDPRRVTYWKQQLDALGDQPKVGISWRSMARNAQRDLNYTNLWQWSSIFSVRGVTFVNLQYDDCQAELKDARQRFGVEIHVWEEIDLLNDLDEAAALTAALDMVIAPGTSVSAMAGALGKQVLQFVASDYWPALGSDKEPWFPNMKLFVRKWGESWEQILEAIAYELMKVAADINPDSRAGLFPQPESRLPESERSVPNLKPRNIPRTMNVAVEHHRAGRLAQAEVLYRQVLEAVPKHPDALHLLGRITMERGEPVKAADLIAKAISINPDPTYFFNMALVKRASNLFDEAISSYQKALSLKPDFFEAYNNLGNELRDQGKVAESIDCYQKALKIKPDFAEAHCNLGDAYKIQGGLDRALACYQRALSLKPEYSEAHNGLGVVLADQADFDAAIDHYLRALAFKADNPATLCNLGLAYRTKGDISKSIEVFERAVSQQPDRAEYHWNLALSLLASGDLAQGWQEYDWRWNRKHAWQFPPPAKRDFPQPWWNGESVETKTILIWAEQGVGDSIAFANALPDILTAAKHCVVECDPRLVSLFARSFPTAEVVPRLTPPDPRCLVSDIDLQIPIGSLLRWFRPSIESFPNHRGYLIPDLNRVAYWKKRLDAIDDHPKVGICWRSMFRNILRDQNYTDLGQWGSIFSVQGVTFVNLQYDDCRAELEAAKQQFGVDIHAWNDIDLLNDLDEAAALTAALDVVISACTSVAATAGALGKKVLEFTTSDNWSLMGTNGEPCFPDMELFIRKWGDSWETILKDIADRLTELSSFTVLERPAEVVKATADAGRSALSETISKAIRAASEYQQAGRFSEAEAIYSQVLQVQPNNPQVLNLLGVMAHQMGDSQLAIELIGAAIELEPFAPSFHNNLGSVFEAMERLDKAVNSYIMASNMQPDYADAHYNLGTVQYRLGRKEEAVACFNRALIADPDLFKAHNNLGVVLAELSDFDGVIRHYLQALEIEPDHIAALSNLANAYRMRGELAKSIELHQRVLTLEAGRAESHWNLSLALLASGNLTQGWQEYDWRWKGQNEQWTPPPPKNRNFPQPWWGGEDPTDKTLLVWGEQGVGDEITFASVLPDIIAAAKHCVVECESRLVSLFARSFPTAEIVARSLPPDPRTLMSDIDLQIPIGSLSRWFRQRLENFPNHDGYLVPDPRRLAYWKQRLNALGDQPKVGICWRSMLRNTQRDLYYADLGQWGPIFSVAGVSFVNLQYDDCRTELEDAQQRFGVEIHVWDEIDLLNDLDESAALTAALDVVITPGTAVAGMAGAVGKPVLQFVASDYWPMLGTNKLPWLPNTKLFVRNWGEPWENIIVEIARDLSERFSFKEYPRAASEHQNKARESR